MIARESPYSALQQVALVVLRFVTGWHLFYQGLGKLRETEWSSRGFLANASGWFGDWFKQIADWPAMLSLADFLVVWGLLLAGLFLMLGLLSRTSAAVGLALVFLFFIAAPPLPVMGFTVPGPDGFELYVNKTLIEALSLLVLAVFPTGQMAGLDILISNWREKRRSVFAS